MIALTAYYPIILLSITKLFGDTNVRVNGSERECVQYYRTPDYLRGRRKTDQYCVIHIIMTSHEHFFVGPQLESPKHNFHTV